MPSRYEKPESFKINGFVLIPDVVGQREIHDIRNLIYEITEQMPIGKRMLTIGDIFSNKDLSDALLKIQFSEKLLKALSNVIDEKFCYINDVQVQCNMFGVDLWHADAGSEADILSNKYLYDPDFVFGKVGVFLQDNTAEFGGGINVIPGSHKAFKFYRGKTFLEHACRYVINKTQVFNARNLGRQLVVPIKAGSAVYFDSRLLHCSTTPESVALNAVERNARRVKNSSIGKANSKYVFYWEACSQDNAKAFLENSCKRAIVEEVGISRRQGIEIFYSEYLGYHYPDDYPREYIECVEKSDLVSIACIDRHNSKFWKIVRNSLLK